MENGESDLDRKFEGLTVSDHYNINGNDGLYQVIKAVEAAEATIKQQVEENNRLRYELQKRNEELEKSKSVHKKQQSHQWFDQWGDRVDEPYAADQMILHVGNQTGGVVDANFSSGHGVPSSTVIPTNMVERNNFLTMQSHMVNQFGSSKVNGSSDIVHGSRVASDYSGISKFVSPSIAFDTSSRHYQEGDSDSEFRFSGRNSVSVAAVNNNNSSKQDIIAKIRENEEEILQYKRHLTELSIKEAQIHNEKYALEKRVSYMRLAFDQQQQDLVNASSKAISYQQDIMEENVRLTYALQAAKQERSTFVASLMPLLAEYSLQPPAADSQSIVSNVKVLFRHLQEQLHVIEGRVKESQYQLAPWRSESNSSSFPHSPVYPVEMKNELELVPQPKYSDGMIPTSVPQTTLAGDILDLPQSGVHNPKNMVHVNFGKRPTPASRDIEFHEVPSQLAVSQADTYLAGNQEGMGSKKVTFGDFTSIDMDEPENRGHTSDRDPSINWNPKASATALDEPNLSYSLPPVFEEPSSSFSEGAEDDPLPAIEGLQISGEAFPGQQLQASGYSVNGTTSCNFEWVRHMDDGSFNFVEGAKQPNYLVTADDVDTYLAIEVQPLDDRKRKGELVVVFANEHRKITCDPAMQQCIEKILYAGHASYKLSLSAGYLDIWEPATLSIKKDGYSIKGSDVVVNEKFSSSTIVSIPFGSETEFSIFDSEVERVLKVDDSLNDVSSARDTIVLTLRLFIFKALERKKGRKRGLFFHK